MAEKEKEKSKQGAAPKPPRPPAKPARAETPKVAVESVIEKAAQAPRLKLRYREEVIASFLQDGAARNPFEVPHIDKIVINIGVSEAKENIQALDQAREELSLIAGQVPQVRRAKKSISNFKLREGMPIGLRVTLRGDRMYEFMDRLVSIAMPRIRDFRGLEPRGFDGRGNFNLGLKEHLIFPELHLDKTNKARGMNITFVTTAKTDKEGFELLERMGMPFKKRQKKA
ncbi:MAG: 50S ribosomal protein L5 [Elusimicrobiota bacterium]